MKGKHNLNMSFAEKDIVKFNPAFCSESERDKLYIILECYDDVQRARIAPVECPLSIVPVESVTYEMIMKA